MERSKKFSTALFVLIAGSVFYGTQPANAEVHLDRIDLSVDDIAITLRNRQGYDRPSPPPPEPPRREPPRRNPPPRFEARRPPAGPNRGPRDFEARRPPAQPERMPRDFEARRPQPEGMRRPQSEPRREPPQRGGRG